MKGNVENKNNNPVNIRFVAKTSGIRNLSENMTSDVMLKYQKWQHWYQGWSLEVAAAELHLCFVIKGDVMVETHFSSDGYYRCVTS